ncbi:MAG TPA: AAA family ATPase [Planktothrix sp.]|jgi:5-methylcytosine-specific restriction endonuclease McrBC GTP-binding regulatory subunit McrB
MHSYVEPEFESIKQTIDASGAVYSFDLLRRYHLSLRTRRFVILYGVSGSGKTLLTRMYANAVGAYYQLVPVAPNWTTNEDLLGYYNPLSKQYHDTDFSLFLRQAARAYQSAVSVGEVPEPFHLVLDEMNLARVEYYFAKFLSGMEVLTAAGHAQVTMSGPDVVDLTPNLFFIGTVNVDETTQSFADKIFDRAQVIEVTHHREEVASRILWPELRDLIMPIWDAVSDVAPFSIRVVDEITRYVNEAARIGLPWEVALDDQIIQKILPRIKGTDIRLGAALQRLSDLTANRFPRSHSKIQQLNYGFHNYGIVSFF